MKNTIKTIKSVLAVTVVALLVGASAEFANAQARAPRDPDTKQALDINHVGAKVCRSNQTVNQKFCAAGAGRLYELCAFGTNVLPGKGAMAFDTVSSAQWLNGSPDFQTTYGISPIVYGTGPAASTGDNAYSLRCWKPSVPVRFENGLGILADHGGTSVIAVYRLDSGINP